MSKSTTKKADLPTKLCPVCQRPFSWRKKWERCWDEVKYCSDRCRNDKPSVKTTSNINPLPPIVNRKSQNRKS